MIFRFHPIFKYIVIDDPADYEKRRIPMLIQFLSYILEGDPDKSGRDGGDGQPRLDAHHTYQKTPSQVMMMMMMMMMKMIFPPDGIMS